MGLEVSSLEIADVKVIKTQKFPDRRGFFSEVYNKKAFAASGIEITFVQDNHSVSAEKGVVRGLHFQIAPFAQTKLVRVVRGAVFDVAVDLRRSSPTRGKHVSTILSAAAWNQMLIPVGFAHGFMTLEPDTEVIYKVDNYYAPEYDRGIQWDDPDLAIQWPLPKADVLLSEKDRKQPRFHDVVPPFD